MSRWLQNWPAYAPQSSRSRCSSFYSRHWSKFRPCFRQFPAKTWVSSWGIVRWNTSGTSLHDECITQYLVEAQSFQTRNFGYKGYGCNIEYDSGAEDDYECPDGHDHAVFGCIIIETFGIINPLHF